MNKKNALLIGLIFLLFTLACSQMMKGKEIAEPAVEKFHTQFNAKQFTEIYNEADPEFKTTVTEEELVTLLEAVHRKLGTVTKANAAGWNVNATTAGTLVKLSYDVDFSEGKGTEEFVYRVNGDKAGLYNYHVNSPLLITR